MTPRALRMEGPWHKGNLHLHTNRSDGRLALASMAGLCSDRCKRRCLGGGNVALTLRFPDVHHFDAATSLSLSVIPPACTCSISGTASGLSSEA